MTPALSGGARRRPPSLVRWLERLLILIVSLAISVGVIALLSGGLLAGRDSPGLYGPTGQLGVQFRDQGDAILAPGARAPAYDSVPPTSGAHRPARIVHAGSTLSDDQLLTALAAGNVVVMYGTKHPPPGLRSLAASIAAPFSPALASAGQAVILARRPAIPGVLALAWTRLLHVRSATDPQLRSFVLVFLGQGARRH
ncbi:MAG: hypothetical protein QOF83_708 [Solirubrobacteraceae bacterium]|nr:hypothetical protein [Solirubrobacteraceae bacterium]